MTRSRIGVPVMLALAGMSSGVLAGADRPAGEADARVRATATFQTDAGAEIWLLEWRGPTTPVCAPDDPAAYTCPCSGFAFGEAGHLELVRERDGRTIERLPLDPLFTDGFPAGDGQAALRRHDVRDGDSERSDSDAAPQLVAEVSARPESRVLDPGDYDHDGHASEFVLQVATEPCGKHMGVLIGVSRARPTLHAFGSAAHPDRSLLLQTGFWEALRSARGPIREVAWRCGDHASETQIEQEIETDAAGIRVVEREFACTDDGGRGALLHEEIH